MIVNSMNTAAALAFLGAIVITGCETATSNWVYSPALDADADFRNASAAHDRWLTSVYEQKLESWDSRPASATANTDFVQWDQPALVSNGREPVRVGVYGELIGDDSYSPVVPDGTENLSQVTYATEGGCRSPHMDSSGRWLTMSATMHRATADVYKKSVDGRTMTQLTSDPADDLTPRFSPNGEMIAFASNRSGNWDIWMIPADGGVPIQVTDSEEHELHPTFSPDGRQVAYCRFGRQSGQWEIWMSDLGRPGVQRFLTYGLFPEWSPDHLRSRMTFQRPRQRGSRYHSVWTLDLKDGEATNISEVVSAGNAAAMHPSWSPDGRSLVFITVVEPDSTPGARPQVSDVWTIDSDGRNRRNLTQGRYSNLQPSWGSDGRVYFVSDRSGVENVWSVRGSDEHSLRTWEEDLVEADGEH